MSTALAARTLVASTRWLALATISAAGEPATSYVPFACSDGAFGVVLSGLAAHTAELRTHPRASVLLVSEPAPEDDPFARPRLTLDVVAHDVGGSPRGDAIWEALAARNGATVDVLRALPDFRPFRLEPVHGRFVLGFARAGDLDGEALAEMMPDED